MKIKAKTTDKDKGEKLLLKQLADLKNSFVEAGLFEGEDHPESELSIAQIGAVHEFGTEDGHIPPRPWLSRTHDENEARYRKLMDEAYSRILSGQTKVGMALLAVGERIASDARGTITAVKEPPKADATLKKEGERFTNPLVWLGYMRAAVRSRITVKGSKTMTPKGSR